MAKNISVNEWLTDIHDDTYANVVSINNMLLINFKLTNAQPNQTILAKIRDTNKLFYNKQQQYGNGIYLDQDSNIRAASNLTIHTYTFLSLMLKNKQLETDFYTTEQLAEMYPDDPSYRQKPVELLPGENADTGPIVTEVNKNDESS